VALSRLYGRLEIPTIGDDEPVFIIRAQDSLAESAMQMYRLLAEAHGCQIGPVLNLEIEGFRRWQGERRLPLPAAPEKPELIDRVPRILRRR
jgi:hypothetical protein